MLQYETTIKTITKIRKQLCKENKLNELEKTEDILNFLKCPLFLKLANINKPMTTEYSLKLIENEKYEALKNYARPLKIQNIQLIEFLGEYIEFSLNSSSKAVVTKLKPKNQILDPRFDIGDEILAINDQILFKLNSFNHIVQILYNHPKKCSVVVAKTNCQSESSVSIEDQSEVASLSCDIKEIEVVYLERINSNVGFGLIEKPNVGFFIRTIVPNGAAEKNGRLFSGDELLKVDDVVVKGLKIKSMAKVLNESSEDVVRIVVSRNIQGDAPFSDNVHYLAEDAIDDFIQRNDNTNPYLEAETIQTDQETIPTLCESLPISSALEVKISDQPNILDGISNSEIFEEFITHSLLRKTNNLLDFTFRFAKSKSGYGIWTIVDSVLIDTMKVNSIEGNVILTINNIKLEGKSKSEIIEVLTNIPNGPVHLETLSIEFLNEGSLDFGGKSSIESGKNEASCSTDPMKFFSPKKFNV